MSNQKVKGFTLIELLAVIVILAIIAVIAVPIVLNIIEKTKDNANKESIGMYGKALEFAIASSQLKGNENIVGTYTTTDGKTLTNTSTNQTITIDYSGSKIVCEEIVISEDGKYHLSKCKIDDQILDNYSSGTMTLRDHILTNYGGEDSISEVSTSDYSLKTFYSYSTQLLSSENLYATDEYYFGSSYEYNKETGLFTLSGDIEKCSILDKHQGKACNGKDYTVLSKTSETATNSKVGVNITSAYYEVGIVDLAYISEYVSELKTVLAGSGVRKKTDDLGTSYVFVGDVDNNYVKFGSYAAGSTVNGTTYNSVTPMYWRIVRVNSDGTIRLIYAGTSVNETTPSIGTTSDMMLSNFPERSGYTYGETTQTNSATKTIIDNWYSDHLYNKFDDVIADQIFCNDRQLSRVLYFDWSGQEVDKANADVAEFEYSSLQRYNSNNPQLTCPRDEDKYTVNTKNGNGYLTHPVGLLSMDEALIAIGKTSGGTNYLAVSKENSYNWSSGFKLMSSVRLQAGTMTSTAYGVGDSVQLYNDSFEYQNIRPVINLSADVEFTGKGTIDSPYEIIS